MREVIKTNIFLIGNLLRKKLYVDIQRMSSMICARVRGTCWRKAGCARYNFLDWPGAASSKGPMRVKYPAALLLIASFSICTFAADAGDAEPIRLASLDDKHLDASALSYDLVRSFMTEKQWEEQVSELRERFEDWERNNEGDIGRYLNDRFIMVALGAVGGEVEKIKRGIIWLAFYKEFNQQVPRVVSNAVLRHRESLTRLFKDFSWEKASQYVKNKEWRNDNKKAETARDENKDSKKGS